jgi:hypothetical protein
MLDYIRRQRRWFPVPAAPQSATAGETIGIVTLAALDVGAPEYF